MNNVEKEFYSRYSFSELKDSPRVDCLGDNKYRLVFLLKEENKNDVKEHCEIRIYLDGNKLTDLYNTLNEGF